MTRPLRDNNAARTQVSKCFRSGTHEHRICVHLDAADVFDVIRLEQDRLVAEVQLEYTERSRKGIG